MVGFGPVVTDVTAWPEFRRFYEDALGLPFADDDAYSHTGDIDGIKHISFRHLTMFADMCFGTDTWPIDVPPPRGWIEVEVADIEEAIGALMRWGCRRLGEHRCEQLRCVSFMLSPDGFLVAITHANPSVIQQRWRQEASPS